MVHIVFEYRDEYCKDGKFRRQECNVRSLEECKQIYGLDTCEYRIISIDNIEWQFVFIFHKSIFWNSTERTARESRPFFLFFVFCGSEFQRLKILVFRIHKHIFYVHKRAAYIIGLLPTKKSKNDVNDGVSVTFSFYKKGNQPLRWTMRSLRTMDDFAYKWYEHKEFGTEFVSYMVYVKNKLNNYYYGKG